MLIVAGLLVAGAAVPQPLTMPDVPRLPGRDREPGVNLHDALQDLYETRIAQGDVGAVARRYNLRLPVADMVRVEILDSQRLNLRGFLRGVGAVIEVDRPEGVQALVPVERLRALASRGYVRLVQPAQEATLEVGAYTSEGVARTDADDWHGHSTHPYNGAGGKVAIVDAGFQNYTTYQSSGDIAPAGRLVTQNYRSDGNFTSTKHGSGCAEVVYDMAPGCTQYLVAINTNLELYSALDWLENDGTGQTRVDAITMSLGWFNMNFYNGTGTMANNCNDTISKGVFFATSAGNQGESHLGDTFDPDAWGSHLWPSTDWYGPITTNPASWTTLTAGTPFAVYLTWDAWPTTNQDFDLYLWRHTGTVAASSTVRQTGSQPPTEWIPFTAEGGVGYAIEIRRHSASALPRMHVHVAGAPVMLGTNNVPATSITNPADVTNILTVGATYHSNDAIESFSSRGPREGTGDTAKPNLTAPDGVSCNAYTGGFFGTSAASPHVGGAAALFLQQNPTRTPAQLKAMFEAEALDLGAVAYDNTYGAGRLKMPLEASNFAGGSPLPVVITSLRAHATALGNVVVWETNPGVPLAGFQLFRSHHRDGPWQPLETGVIEPRRGRMVYFDRSPTGASAWYAVHALGAASQPDEWAQTELRSGPLGILNAARPVIR